MSPSRGVLVGIAAYLLVGLLLVSGALPPLAVALLAAPYTLLVPCGLGLLLCFGWRRSIPSGFGRVQMLLLAWLFGTLIIIYAYVMLERYGLTRQLADTVLLAFYVLGAAGLLCMRVEHALSDSDYRILRQVVLITVPLVIFRYLAEIVVYSDFPVIDLFQRAHFHKGALELAKYDVLNPFVANSYIPFQQLLLGLLARGAHVDPLLAEWILPVTLAPLQVCAVFVVAARLTRSRAQLGLAIGLSLAMMSQTNPTNGYIASMAAMLILSLLVSDVSAVESAQDRIGKAFLVAAATVVSLVLFRAPVLASFAALLALSSFVSWPGAKPVAARSALLVVAVVTTIAFHRAAMLFISFVIVVYVALAFQASIRSKATTRVMAWASMGFALLVAGMVAHILINGGRLPQDEFGLWSAFDYLLNPLTGKRMADVAVDLDFAPGVGGRVALFEVGRNLSLLGVVVGGIFMLRTTLKAGGLLGKGGDGAMTDEPGVPLMLACLLLLALTLTGFPFVHRAAFLIVVLLSIAIACFVFPSGGSSGVHLSGGRAVSAGLLAYMVVLLTFIALAAGPRVGPYLARAYPLLFALLAAGLALAARPAWTMPGAMFGALVVVAVLFEATASRAYFKPYAFSNQTPPEAGAFSHYGHKELAMAEQVAGTLGGNSVLVSDPKTMALIGARSGLPPLMSFSNLNTMNEGDRRVLINLLRKVAGDGGDGGGLDICADLLRIAKSKASGQTNYFRVRRLVDSGMGRDTLAALGYNDALLPRPVTNVPVLAAKVGVNDSYSDVNSAADDENLPSSADHYDNLSFAVVLSPDTLDWIDHPTDPSYFPVEGGVSERLGSLALLRSRGRIVGNAFVLVLTCK